MVNNIIAGMAVRLGLDLSEFQEGIRAIKGVLQSMGNEMQALGGAMTLGITVPLVTVGGTLAAFAGEFESGMKRVQAVTDASVTEFKSLERAAIDLGKTSAFGPAEVTKAMAELGVAGLKTNEILSATPNVLKLAAIEQMSMAKAAEITASILRGFNIPVADLAKSTDVLAKASIDSNTSLTELGSAMKYAGPAAQLAGLQFNEVVAAIGLLSDAGIKGSMAGTTLRGEISRLLSPTKEAAKIMKELGISVKDTHGNILPLADIVKQFEVAMKNTGDKAKFTGQMLEIFGDRAGPGMAALVTKGSEALRDFTKSLDDSGGTADRVAKIQLEGLQGAMKKFRATFEATAIEFGKSLTPIATSVVEWATGLVQNLQGIGQAFSELPQSMQATVLGFGSLLAVAGPALTAVGFALSNMDAGIQTLGKLKDIIMGGGAAAGLVTAFAALASAATLVAGVVQFGGMVNDVIALGHALFNTNDLWKGFSDAVFGTSDATEKCRVNLKLMGEELDGSKSKIGGAREAWRLFVDDLRKNWLNYLTGPIGTARMFIQKLTDDIHLLRGTLLPEMAKAAENNLSRVQKSNMDYMKSEAEKQMKLTAGFKASADQARAWADDMDRANKKAAASSEFKKLQNEISSLGKRLRDELSDLPKTFQAFQMAMQEGFNPQAAIKKLTEDLSDMKNRWDELPPKVKGFYLEVDLAKKQLEGFFREWKAQEMLADLDKLTAKINQGVGPAMAKWHDQNRDLQIILHETLKPMDEAIEKQKIMDLGQKETFKAGMYLLQQYGKDLATTSAEMGIFADTTQSAFKELEPLGRQISTIFDDLGKDITTAILKGKDLGDVFVNAFAAMGKAVLRFTVEFMVKNFLKSIFDATNATFNLGGAFSKVFGGLKNMLTGGGGGGKVSMPGGKDSPLAGMGGLVNTLTSIGSLVTDIFSFFGQRRIEKDVGRIEVTSRGILNQLLSIQGDVNKYWPYLAELAFLGTMHQDLLAILTVLEAGGVAFNPDGSPVTPTDIIPTETPVEETGPPMLPVEVTDEMMQTTEEVSQDLSSLGDALNTQTETVVAATEELQNVEESAKDVKEAFKDTASAATQVVQAGADAGQFSSSLSNLSTTLSDASSEFRTFAGVARTQIQESFTQVADSMYSGTRVLGEVMRSFANDTISTVSGLQESILAHQAMLSHSSDPNFVQNKINQMQNQLSQLQGGPGSLSNPGYTAFMGSALGSHQDPGGVNQFAQQSAGAPVQMNFYGVTDPRRMADKIFTGLRDHGLDI